MNCRRIRGPTVYVRGGHSDHSFKIIPYWLYNYLVKGQFQFRFVYEGFLTSLPILPCALSRMFLYCLPG